MSGSPPKNYISVQGAERLRDELHRLLAKERPEVVRVVSWAASNGDRSENGDYIYGKRKLREIDRRIRFLEKRLEIAEVIDPAKQRIDRVCFGVIARIQEEDGTERTYQILGVDEVEPTAGAGSSVRKVSWISPVAKALLNAKVGDIVTLRSPQGEKELEILEIRAPA